MTQVPRDPAINFPMLEVFMVARKIRLWGTLEIDWKKYNEAGNWLLGAIAQVIFQVTSKQMKNTFYLISYKWFNKLWILTHQLVF